MYIKQSRARYWLYYYRCSFNWYTFETHQTWKNIGRTSQCIIASFLFLLYLDIVSIFHSSRIITRDSPWFHLRLGFPSPSPSRHEEAFVIFFGSRPFRDGRFDASGAVSRERLASSPGFHICHKAPSNIFGLREESPGATIAHSALSRFPRAPQSRRGMRESFDGIIRYAAFRIYVNVTPLREKKPQMSRRYRSFSERKNDGT